MSKNSNKFVCLLSNSSYVKLLITIHILSEEDLADFTRLSLALWPEGVFAEELDQARNLLSSHKDAVYLARVQSENIAFIHVSLRTDYVEGTESSPVGYIEGIYVSPSYRRKDVATQLLVKAENWARQKGCKEMGSDTEISNLLSQQFHQSSGFAEVNRIVCYRKPLS